MEGQMILEFLYQVTLAIVGLSIVNEIRGLTNAIKNAVWDIKEVLR